MCRYFENQFFEVKNNNELFQLIYMMGNDELARYILDNGSIDVNAYKITAIINHLILFQSKSFDIISKHHFNKISK